jgi:hypothetical protein
MTWIDQTVYRTDEQKQVPRTWSASLGGYMRLLVTKESAQHPGEWVMKLYPIVVDPVTLELPAVAAADVAQARAVEIARDVLAICLKALR